MSWVICIRIINALTHTHTHPPTLTHTLSHHHTLTHTLPPSQKGDIILRINSVSLIGKTHAEAIQMIKSITSSSTIRLELVQGDGGTEGNGGLSPDWKKWLKHYESGHQRCVYMYI